MSALNQQAEIQLGPAILEFRRRHRFAIWLDSGGTWLHVALMPLMAGLAASIATAAICHNFEVPRSIGLPAAAFLFVATAVIIFTMGFSRPQTVSLALHERGFRYQNEIIPFTELWQIRTGAITSELREAFHELTLFMAKFHRASRLAAALHEQRKQATLTVMLRGGRALQMKNALVEFEEADLALFMEGVRNECPEALTDRPAWLPPSVAAKEQPAVVEAPRAKPLATTSREGLDPACGDADAGDARDALARNDYREAGYLLKITKDHKRREFYLRTLQEWTGRPFALERWKDEEPENPNAWLVSGAHLIHWSWEALGGRPLSEGTTETRAMFRERLGEASLDLDRAAILDMEDPAAHAFQLRVCTGLGTSRDETLRVFKAALQSCPDHYLAHSNLLSYFSQAWHGSHEEMLEFARVACRKAPEGSLLPVLIAEAHIERWRYAREIDRDPNCDDYFKHPDVRQELNAAYAHSLGSPLHQPTLLSRYAANYFAFSLGPLR